MTGTGRRRAPAWLRSPWTAAYAASLVLLVVNLFIAHSLRGYNSDDVALQTILGQWRRGYHATAHLGADSFILKVPLYLLVASLFENGRTALLVTTLVLNVMGFSLYVWSIRYFATRFSVDHERPHLFIWPLLWVAGLGLILANALITPNLRNVEIGLAFFLIALVAKFWDGELEASPAWLLIAVPLLGLFLYDDPYFLFLCVVPLLALLAASRAIRPFDRRTTLLGAFLLGGILAYKVFEVVFRSFGIHPAKADTSLAGLDGIRHHFRILVHGSLLLFEADLISNGLSLARPRLLLNLAVLLCTLLYPVALWRRRVRFADEPWKWFFGLYPILVAAVFVFSTQAIDLHSARYLVLLPFLSVLVLGVGFHEITDKRLRTGAVLLVALATTSNVVSTLDEYRSQPGGPNRLNYTIVNAVGSKGLTKGYAEYWSSNINTYLSEDRVDFIQVTCEESRVEPYEWLTDDGIHAKRASRTFYLWEGGDPESGCGYDQVLRQFGEPAEVVPVTNGLKLLIYDYDLIRRM